MELTTSQYKRCDALIVSGRIDSNSAPQFAEAMRALTDNGRYKIAIDLALVSFISSAGLRVLIDSQKTCKQLNRGEVVLANVPERVVETLDLAGFLPLFKRFDNITTAIGSF